MDVLLATGIALIVGPLVALAVAKHLRGHRSALVVGLPVAALVVTAMLSLGWLAGYSLVGLLSDIIAWSLALSGVVTGVILATDRLRSSLRSFGVAVGSVAYLGSSIAGMLLLVACAFVGMLRAICVNGPRDHEIADRYSWRVTAREPWKAIASPVEVTVLERCRTMPFVEHVVGTVDLGTLNGKEDGPRVVLDSDAGLVAVWLNNAQLGTIALPN